ncbi:MAG: IS1380 family transposase [Defluviicoccus sp.]|nr:IS1380 family transposase [Defluviicoccus sp.]MDE0277847.1 IS1380 family transposase [Defluviicoccus sp.]
MTEDSLLPFDLPAAERKKVTADFAGGLISSDGGLVLLRAAERRLGLAEALAGCIREWRDPALVTHTLPAMLRFRMFAIACGYEDADDCDALRGDPLFKLAGGRAPVSGRDLCSQPTMSRLENAPSRIEVARMTAALVDLFCRSFPAPPAAITLDIDDTCDRVHGHQQLSLFNAHYDTRCFLPVHVYHVESGRPVAVLLRPGKTPSGVEVRTLIKHLARRIRRHWPRTRLTFRGDSHYGRREAMEWCEANGVDYIFGLAGNTALRALTYEIGDGLKVHRAETGAERMRGFASFDYAAGSWRRKRNVVARLEATPRGFDARYIVTSLKGEPRRLYEGTYCARGQAENLIKQHKVQLASDRTSCQSPLANQFRLVLHTAAYWLMLALRDAVPRSIPLTWSEFATLRQKLLKIGARVIEKAARIRIHFASACPVAALFRMLAGRLAASGP